MAIYYRFLLAARPPARDSWRAIRADIIRACIYQDLEGCPTDCRFPNAVLYRRGGGGVLRPLAGSQRDRKRERRKTINKATSGLSRYVPIAESSALLSVEESRKI